MCCEQCHEAGCKEQQGAQGEVAAGGQAGAQVVGWWWAGSRRTVGAVRSVGGCALPCTRPSLGPGPGSMSHPGPGGRLWPRSADRVSPHRLHESNDGYRLPVTTDTHQNGARVTDAKADRRAAVRIQTRVQRSRQVLSGLRPLPRVGRAPGQSQTLADAGAAKQRTHSQIFAYSTLRRADEPEYEEHENLFTFTLHKRFYTRYLFSSISLLPTRPMARDPHGFFRGSGMRDRIPRQF